MSLFYRILDEHKDWLIQQGYTEQRLNAAEKPGYLAGQLRKEFSNAIQDNLWEKSPEDFSLFITGWFQNNRDMVHFQFNYVYDPNLVRLELRSLQARMDEGQPHTYFIVRNQRYALPEPEKVWERLAIVNGRELISRMDQAAENSKDRHPGKKPT